MSVLTPTQKSDAPTEFTKASMVQLYKEIDSMKDEEDDERELAELFRELPSKKDYPEYYTLIKDPIDLGAIHVSLLWFIVPIF